MPDTTGTGDSFNGALAAGLHAGLSVTEAAKRSVYAGAYAVETEGVIPALATEEALKERFGISFSESLKALDVARSEVFEL